MRRLVQPISEANIIVIFINHINQMVSTGPMPVAADINYLKQGETLPGGRAIQYQSNTLIKITPSTKLTEDKKYKIKGYETKIELVKSRTAPAGNVITMIYNQAEGFDSELTTFDYLKSNNMIKGAGVGMYLESLPDTKFRMSNLKEKLAEDEEFYTHFYAAADLTLEGSLKESSRFDYELKVEPELEVFEDGE